MASARFRSALRSVSATAMVMPPPSMGRAKSRIRPPSAVNLLALDRRLIRSCLMRLGSTRISGKSGSGRTSNICFFCWKASTIASAAASRISPARQAWRARVMLPLSSFEMSSTSVTTSSSRRPARQIWSAYSAACSGVEAPGWRMMSEKPMIAFRGGCAIRDSSSRERPIWSGC